MSGHILNNRGTSTLAEALKEAMQQGDQFDVVSPYFTIYAIHHLLEHLSKSERLRFLLTDGELFANDSESARKALILLLGDKAEVQLKNGLQLQLVAKNCIEVIREKAKIRAVLPQGSVTSNLININKTDGGTFSLDISSSKFTSEGLGIIPTERHGLTTFHDDLEMTTRFKEFFEQLWGDNRLVEDVKLEVLAALEHGAKDQSAQHIYFFTLFNIFKDVLHELDVDKIVNARTGIKASLIWGKLYKFQQDGVIGAIDKIERFGGCIIADSVGLGKTFEALAVIKYYELRNDRVLVLCPKKLRENWLVYRLQNDTRNALADDRFNFDVLNHTDLTREHGNSGDINLATVNWGNYDLVVIDESHNFRNNPSRKKETRYSKLLHKIIKAGVKTKVLMLSATPVNNRMNDLKNQVAFITEGEDRALAAEGIFSIGDTMRNAQTQFNNWLRDSQGKDIGELLEILDGRYFKLLDLLTIARSRKHIEKYYNIAEIGQFPERLKPINIKADIDKLNQFPPLTEINRKIRSLHLSAYSPLKYVRSDKKDEYSRKYDFERSQGGYWRQTDREQSLIHLMRVNMLKRMESSINSFAITVEKLIQRIDDFLEKIQNKSEYIDEELDIESVDIDDVRLQDFLIGNKIKVLLQDMDTIRWKQDLMDDCEHLQEILKHAKQIDSRRDDKLHRLKEVIAKKVANPINHNNQKVIVFTAFADTANYLYDELQQWALEELKVHSALITGSSTNKCNMAGVRSDMNDILINFSPNSKERSKLQFTDEGEITLLFATDCISEGQNLQDCDYLVNYDIHWNPVRIVQRFGRVDRLGSINSSVQLVNFWPNLELDEYLDLENRVSGRMVLLDVSATGEENIIEHKGEMNDLQYRRVQLEQLQDQVVDLEEIAGGISITDLTFNDFRMELMDYHKENGNLLEQTPTGVYSIVQTNSPDLPAGVLFCLRQLKADTNNVLESNPLAPYFLSYISEAGTPVFNFSQSKKALDAYQKLCSGNAEVLEDLVSTLQADTNHLQDMSAYTSVLVQAVQHIVGKREESGVKSLFTTGGTSVLKSEISSLADLEVISFLIIKEGGGA